jgi:hypothetical protein
MSDWPSLIPLVVSAIAVVISATALVMSGRREDLRWKREVLEKTMVSLIDASFGYVDLVDLQAAKEGKDLREYKDRALDTHRVQLDALTKLRLLAKPKVLKLAFELHDLEDKLYSIVYAEALELPQWTKESPEWKKLEARRKELQKQREDIRSDLTNACRRNLGLWRTLPTLPERSVGPSDEEIVLHDMKRKRQDREHPSKQTAGT